MYEYILVLKGDNKNLATYEFEILWETYFNEKIKLEQLHNVFYSFKSKTLIKSENEMLSRLTFTNKLCVKKFQGEFSEFKSKINKLDLEKYDGKKFAIEYSRFKKTIKVENESKELAKPIYDSFKNPFVDLKKFDIKFIFFYKTAKKFIFTELIYENVKDYLRRMPKLRPVAKPYTLKSDMARASINLLGLKQGLILDPFCGIGGILLEAYDMNFEIIGNDISWNDLKNFKENFAYYYPNAKYTRVLADSKTCFLKENSIDGIVTDIPYGKSSQKIGTQLYEDYLKASKKYLKKNSKMVVIYANFVDFERLAKKYFKEIKRIDQYINKSMTRHIIVLENNK